MVMYKNLSRFYSRTSAGKHQLDVHEIRPGFLAAGQAAGSGRETKVSRPRPECAR
jgi:hypothetical protein